MAAPSPAAPTPRRLRRSLTFRLSLGILIPSLVLLTGGALTLQGRHAADEAAEELAAEVFGAVAERVSGRVRTRLLAAEPTARAFAAQARACAVNPEDPRELVASLLPLLQANPGFSKLRWAHADGSLHGVFRDRGGVWLRVIGAPGAPGAADADPADFAAPVAGRRTFKLQPDGGWTLNRHDTQTAFDARGWDYFEAAVAEGDPVWTGPYAFVDPPAPGVTCSTPVFSRDADAGGVDRLMGVLTVDFELDDLSRLAAELAPGGGARVVLWSGGGAAGGPPLTLGHPGLSSLAPGDADAGSTLLPVADLADPELRGFLEDAPAGPPAGRPRRFTTHGAEGTDWIGETRALDLGDAAAPLANAADPDAPPAARVVDALDWRVTVLSPTTRFLAGADAAARRAWRIALIALGLAGLASALFAELFTRPLRRVAEQMERLGGFDLAEPAETGSVFREIDDMDNTLVGLRGSLRSFARYVPPAVVRRQLEAGEPVEAGGRSRPMSFLFTDVAGFTTLAEGADPEELLPALSVYFEALAGEVDATGGTIDKFMGDALMAFWNAPEDDPHHGLHACLAALGCRDAVARVESDEHAGPLLRALARTRFGVATGPAVVGNVGTRSRLNYTALGDTVNLGSRLESLNAFYGTRILVDRATARAAGAAVLLCPIDLVAVKGKHDGVEVFEPLSRLEHASPEEEALVEAATEAHRLLRRAEFVGAAEAFDAALAARPGRRAAEILRDRARALAADPPAAWDGVFRSLSK